MAPPEQRLTLTTGALPGVLSTWTFRAGEAASPLIVADGCVDLIVRVVKGEPPSAMVQEATGRAFHARIEENELLWGIRLDVGYGGPLRERNRTISLRAVELVERGGSLRELEALVGEELHAFGEPPEILRDFLMLAKASAGTSSTRTLAWSLATERRMQRAAHRWLGTTAKTYLRIERAHAAREAILRGLPLVEVAGELGYADQSHLTREVRELLGTTPRLLRLAHW